MHSPWPPLIIASVYIFISLNGKKLTQNYPALRLRWLLVVYNLALVALSAYMTYEVGNIVQCSHTLFKDTIVSPYYMLFHTMRLILCSSWKCVFGEHHWVGESAATNFNSTTIWSAMIIITYRQDSLVAVHLGSRSDQYLVGSSPGQVRPKACL